MSHFTVLVIGPNPDEQLAPYHEFECTGRDDQYVQDLDITDEARKEYEEDSAHMVRSPTGLLLSRYDDRFYREPTPAEQRDAGGLGLIGCGGNGEISWSSKDWGDGRGHRAKVHELPQGWSEEDVPMPQVRSFLEWLDYAYGYHRLQVGEKRSEDHKFGFVLVNGDEVVQVVRRTNPNSKWDWYTRGGRWSGFFPLKGGGTADETTKGEVDFERARQKAELEARLDFSEWKSVFESQGRPRPWVEFYGRVESGELTIDAAREAFHAQDAIKTWKGYSCPVERFGFDEEAYVAKQRDVALVPYAIVQNSQWCGKGDMGWFGVSRNDQPQEEWNRKVQDLFDSLPDDTELTLVDCHI